MKTASVSKNGVGTNRIKAAMNGHAATEPRVVVRLETITPEMARRELDKSAAVHSANPERKNRKKSDDFVLELAQAIESGEWEVNGETIKFASDGFLEDGQHRLEAICVAGKAIQTYVVRGLRDGCFDTIDRGRARTMGQILHRHGEVNTNVLAASLNYLQKYLTDSVRRPAGRARPARVLELLAKHPGIRDSIRVVMDSRHLMPLSIAGCCHYLFSRVDGEAADAFFSQLISGEHMTRTQGVYHLRERLKDNRSNRAKISQVEVFALTIKAWNSMRGGAKVKVLRWRTTGETPEEFPRVV